MWALITGASSGIGMETARIFAKNGYNLVLVARRRERLENLEIELKKSVNTLVMPTDISVPENIDILLKKLDNVGIDVDILVNNAGAGSYGSFDELDLKKQLAMIDLNVRALTHMSKVFAEKMKKNGKGTIINIASTAAFQAIPYMAVYAATKSYVLSFSLALSAELEESGVKVVAFCPGATDTEFQKVGNLKTSKMRGALLRADDVARMIYSSVNGGKKVVVTGFYNKFLIFMNRFLPRYFIAKLVKKSYDM